MRKIEGSRNMGRAKQTVFSLLAVLLCIAVVLPLTAVVLHLYLTHKSLAPEDAGLQNEARVYGRLLMSPLAPRLKALRWPMLRPNASASVEEMEVRTNSLGFRDLPQATSKDEDAFRLVVIGDSYVYGQGVASVYDIYPYRIGLNEVGEKDLSVLLMGYCGADLIVYHAMFHDLALRLDPDAVLVTLVSNDLEDRTGRQAACLPGTLQKALNWSPALTAEAERRCNNLTGHYSKELKRQFDPDSESFRKEYSALADMKAEADRRGIDLFAFFFHFRPGAYMEATYRDMASSLDIPYASLYPVAERMIGSGEKKVSDFTVSSADGHPNEFAHDLAGKVVAEFLEGYYGLPGGGEKE
jgi:hypothetical protein